MNRFRIVVAVVIAASVCAGSANAALGPAGTATMHGDAESTDTSPYPGPTALNTHFESKLAACPTVLSDADGMIWALCTKILGRAPVAMLLDPETGKTLASLNIAKGALLGGVYAYLDDLNHLVLVDGRGHLVKLDKQKPDEWSIEVAEDYDLSSFLHGGDAVVGLTSDVQNNIWLATAQGKVGLLRPGETNVEQLNLGHGERIDNSISSSQHGVAIATSHALYMLRDNGGPQVVWREEYDRGSARKPGQLSWGTGATPSFFGDNNGYVTITDNADDNENLLVYRVDDGTEVCRTSIGGGSENSAIAYGNSVIVANTYGYPYPAVPEGAGPSFPALANFSGGMQKFEVKDGECRQEWSKPIASAAVPRLSTVDNKIYTVERPQQLGLTGLAFNAISIDAATGEVVQRKKIADTPLQDTLQMVGTITPDGVWWQGAVSGVFRIS